MKTLKCIALAALLLGASSIQNTAMAGTGTVKSDLPGSTVKVEKKPEGKTAPATPSEGIPLTLEAGREKLRENVEKIRTALSKKLEKELTVKVIYYAKENASAAQDSSVIVFDMSGTELVFMLYRIGPDWQAFPDTFGRL